ncbi:hypothetical protein NE237_031692 [Protea cynaroides]|uniref:Uncharacterized protein n=1 Tax=Protea cynaroides TaxID=273540 RepID=A0A9Q0L217_9MAGN|nr:hypothetical protein NE237_031692 [Protea cynaroides]
MHNVMLTETSCPTQQLPTIKPYQMPTGTSCPTQQLPTIKPYQISSLNIDCGVTDAPSLPLLQRPYSWLTRPCHPFSALWLPHCTPLFPQSPLLVSRSVAVGGIGLFTDSRKATKGGAGACQSSDATPAESPSETAKSGVVSYRMGAAVRLTVVSAIFLL